MRYNSSVSRSGETAGNKKTPVQENCTGVTDSQSGAEEGT